MVELRAGPGEVSLPDADWMEDAECRKIDLPPRERVKLFFPDQFGSATEGRKVCARCPVRAECRNYAEVTGSVGMWAGEFVNKEA